MADFPTSLPNLSGTDYANNTPLIDIHPDLHDSVNEELDAVIAKVGIDSSADTDSLDYKLKSASSSNPGHKHTLDNGATDIITSWDSYVPSWTNLTVGSGTNAGSYKQIGKTVFFKIKFTFAADSSISTGVSVTIPVANSIPTGITDPSFINIIIRDASPAGNYLGIARHDSATTIVLSTFTVSGALIVPTALSNTNPITFTTDDVISVEGFYEAE